MFSRARKSLRFLSFLGTLSFIVLTSHFAHAQSSGISGASGSGSTGMDYYGGGTMCGISDGSGLDFGPCGPGERCVPFIIPSGGMGGVCEPCADATCGCSASEFACGTSCCSMGATCYNGACVGGSSSSSSSASSSSASSSSASSSSVSSSSESSSSISSSSASSSSVSSSSESSSSISSSSSSSSAESSTSSSSISSSSSSESSSSSSSSSSASSNSSSQSSSSSLSSSASSESSVASSSSSSSTGSTSSSSSSSSLPPGCEPQVITTQKDALEIGPELLKNKALATLKRLVKFSTSRAIRKQLSEDSKRSAKKMEKFILEAIVSLQQLPDIQVVCNSEQYCALVDNTSAIKQHIRALEKLRNQIIRTLNRSTRLAYPTVAQAQAATKKYGREVKRYTKGLVTKAKALPQVRYQCS